MITQLGGELAAPDAKQVGKEDLVEQKSGCYFCGLHGKQR